jgi:hypothetical protein
MLRSSRSLSFRPRWNIKEWLAMRFLVETVGKMIFTVLGAVAELERDIIRAA